MSRPFVDQAPRPPEPVWFFCCECQQTYDGRDGHQCGPDDPLAPSEGIFLALCGAVVVWSLLYLAGVIRFGWPPR